MNNDFVFTPNLNPYADNAKFIKKTMKLQHCVFIALGIAAMLVCLVYAVIFIFNMTGGRTALETPEDEVVRTLTLSLLGTRMFYFIIIFLLPGIGTVNFIEHLRDKESPYLPNSFTNMGSFFFVSFLVYYAAMFFLSFAQLGMTLLYGDYETTEELIGDFAKIFLTDTAAAVVLIVWSISGILFCSSVRNTLKGIMLSDKGSTFFILMSVITAILNGITALVYNISGFEVGIFYLFDGNTFLSDAAKRNPTEIVMFNLFFIASVMAVIGIIGFATDYRRAVRSAQRSFASFGTNLYMNGDSASAAYYQNYYSSPNINDVRNAAGVKTDRQVNVSIPPQPTGREEYMRMGFPVDDAGNGGRSDATIIVCPVCGTANKSGCQVCMGCGRTL